MSESVTKLREAILRRVRAPQGPGLIGSEVAELDAAHVGLRAALAAVEQEMAALETERDELRKDKERLDWLETFVNREPLLLHGGNTQTHGYSGLGLRPGLLVRTLRQAIDGAMGSAGEG